jgi:hypothetical protein
MSRRVARPIFFVCAAVSQGELVTKIVQAASQNEAASLFEKETSVLPKEVMGPFYKKRTQILETTRNLKFSGENRKSVYNDWVVNAMLLKEPENHAYLVFIERVDGKKQPAPKGTIVVPVSDLRFT